MKHAFRIFKFIIDYFNVYIDYIDLYLTKFK
jgi:hypothetical protein